MTSWYSFNLQITISEYVNVVICYTNRICFVICSFKAPTLLLPKSTLFKLEQSLGIGSECLYACEVSLFTC